MPSTISFSSRMCHFGCILPVGAEHLVQRQHRVVGGVIGVVAGRAIDHLLAVAHGEIVGDRDRLVVGDQEAVLRAGRRAPGTHPGVGAGLQQIDRGLAAVSCLRPLSGIHFSWVPQPSSAGCMPSDTKPSTDQVLTNTFIGFGFLERWVSRSAIWMPLTPSLCASWPQPSRLFGSLNGVLGVARDVEQRLLDEPRHHAGIGAAGGDRGGAARALVLGRQQRLAQRVVGALFGTGALVEIEAEPRLDHGVDVERADLAAHGHDIDRRGIDREVDAKALAAARGQQRHQHLAIIVTRDRPA